MTGYRYFCLKLVIKSFFHKLWPLKKKKNRTWSYVVRNHGFTIPRWEKMRLASLLCFHSHFKTFPRNPSLAPLSLSVTHTKCFYSARRVDLHLRRRRRRLSSADEGVNVQHAAPPGQISSAVWNTSTEGLKNGVKNTWRRTAGFLKSFHPKCSSLQFTPCARRSVAAW